MHILHGKYESAVPSFVLPKHGPDNLEGEQHYDRAYINGNFSSVADSGQGKEDMKPIDSSGFQFCGCMNDELLVNYHEATGSKKSRDSEIGGMCMEQVKRVILRFRMSSRLYLFW